MTWIYEKGNPTGGGGGETPDVFSVLSVSGSEVGPKYQDEQGGLHTAIGLVAELDVDFSHAHTVTFWVRFGVDDPIWQGWYSLTEVDEVVRLGDQTLGSDGTRKSGTIWVPANVDQGTWTVWCAPGRIDKNVDPTGYPNAEFTVTPVGACSPFGTTNCHFVDDPVTGIPVTYYKNDLGVWYWEYYKLEWTIPTLATEPDFWFSMITVQKGATISGVWTPAPDPEGRNTDPDLNYLGRVHDQIMSIAGIAPTAIVVLHRSGASPATWIIPPEQNADGSPNLYREFRFLMYNVSRLGTDSSGSGGAGTYTLQETCWPGDAEFFILSPSSHPGDLDLRHSNPNTLSGPLSGGGGLPITIEPDAITGTYLADDAILARHMAANSVTAANAALAANSVIDANINDVNVSKLIAGTNIFTGDVILSRGSAKPVIVLQNSGINLFSVANSPGSAGLTGQPNVAIESAGISLFSGGNPSTTITSSAITFWSVNGSTTNPYATFTSAGFVVTDGGTPPNAFALSTTGFTLQDDSGSVMTVNAGVMTFASGSSSVTISSTRVAIVKGSFSTASTDYTTQIDDSAGIKLTSLHSGDTFQVLGLPTAGGGHMLSVLQDLTGSAGVVQRIRTVVGAVYGELEILGSGTAVGLGTGAVIKILGGTSAGGTLPGTTTGYITGDIGGTAIRIPYY